MAGWAADGGLTATGGGSDGGGHGMRAEEGYVRREAWLGVGDGGGAKGQLATDEWHRLGAADGGGAQAQLATDERHRLGAADGGGAQAQLATDEWHRLEAGPEVAPETA